MEIATAFLIFTSLLLAVPLAGWAVTTLAIGIIASIKGQDWRTAIQPMLEEW